MVDWRTYLSGYRVHFTSNLWPFTFLPHFVFLLKFKWPDCRKIVLVVLFPKDLKYHVNVVYLRIWQIEKLSQSLFNIPIFNGLLFSGLLILDWRNLYGGWDHWFCRLNNFNLFLFHISFWCSFLGELIRRLNAGVTLLFLLLHFFLRVL